MKAWTARIEFQNRVYDDALRAGDDTGQAFDESFQALLDAKRPDTFSESGEILDERVLRAAQEGNFQQALEGGAKAMGDALQANPFLRVFFPFVKTGHNLTVFGMQHTPVLTRATKEWRMTMEGSDELAKAVLRGRERIGYGLVGSAGMLYLTGDITGAPDPNATQKELQARPPYSIRVLGKWVDYSRITPFDFPLRFVATVGDAYQKSQLNEDQAGYLMSYLAYTLSTNLTQRSVTAGLRPLGELLNPQGTSAENIQASIAGVVNGFVPLSSARRQVNNIFRPFKREFEDQMDRFMDTTFFGLAGESAQQYDWWDGKPIKNLNAGMNAVLNPMNVHDRGTSPGRDFLEDIQYDKNIIFRSMGGIDLKPEHRQAISRLMGEGGLGKELDALSQRPEIQESYKQYLKDIRDPEKTGKVEPIKDTYLFWNRVTDTILAARDVAEYKLQNDPRYADLYAEIQELKYLKATAEYQSKAAEITTVVQNPYGNF